MDQHNSEVVRPNLCPADNGQCRRPGCESFIQVPVAALHLFACIGSEAVAPLGQSPQCRQAADRINHRNGASAKTVLTCDGPACIEVRPQRWQAFGRRQHAGGSRVQYNPSAADIAFKFNARSIVWVRWDSETGLDHALLLPVQPQTTDHRFSTRRDLRGPVGTVSGRRIEAIAFATVVGIPLHVSHSSITSLRGAVKGSSGS